MTFTPAKHLPATLIAFVFIQSLFFKFTGSYETEHIFGTLATWSGLSWFGSFGGYLIGIAELIAAILLHSLAWPGCDYEYGNHEWRNLFPPVYATRYSNA